MIDAYEKTSSSQTPEVTGEQLNEFPLEAWRSLAVEVGYPLESPTDYPSSMLDMYAGSIKRLDHKQLVGRVYGLGLFRDHFLAAPSIPYALSWRWARIASETRLSLS
jgi:hypothetical protein